MTEDLLVERRGSLAVLTLNRPKALNALTLDMAREIFALLRQFEEDDGAACVLVRGAGDRAFCAGGDIRRLYDEGRAGGRYPFEFYRDEYRLNARIFHYAKPYVAFMDGIVMGGGVGLSVHGSHRVLTERTAFAMPETGIGLFPDVGGSHFLPRLPHRIGHYVTYTGARLKAADCLLAGIGDVHVPSDRLDQAEAALAELPPGAGDDAVASVLARFAAPAGEAPLAAETDLIGRLFAADTVPEVTDTLSRDGSERAAAALAAIATKSPTSLKIAATQLRLGARFDFDECMRMEYRIACGCIAGHDFYEGVRAVVIDKDNRPQWQPATLDEVPEEAVNAYFDVPPADGDLTFDTDAANDNADTRFFRDRRSGRDRRRGDADFAGEDRRTGERRSGRDRRETPGDATDTD